MDTRQKITAQLGDLPGRVLSRARGVGTPQTTCHAGIPVTAYPEDPDVAAVLDRFVDEVRRRHQRS